MDSPSFEGFHAQFDCKLEFEFKNKTEQNRNDRKYSQSGKTVIIHTNHDGIRATAIMLRSMVASLEIASESSLINYIDRPSSEQLRACSDVLSDALSGEGHISHLQNLFFLARLTGDSDHCLICLNKSVN